MVCFCFSSRRRHTRSLRDWSSDVCSSDLYLGEAFERELGEGQRRELDAAREDADGRARELHGQVWLSRQLPDYWQRFEGHRAAHAEARLASPPHSGGFLKRLFG